MELVGERGLDGLAAVPKALARDQVIALLEQAALQGQGLPGRAYFPA